MPYDPNHPQPNDPLDADLVRQQMNELKALIDAQAATIATLQGQLANCITQAQLDAAIATCAQNVDGITPQTLGASDPPAQVELQSVMDKQAELITALHR